MTYLTTRDALAMARVRDFIAAHDEAGTPNDVALAEIREVGGSLHVVCLADLRVLVACALTERSAQ